MTESLIKIGVPSVTILAFSVVVAPEPSSVTEASPVPVIWPLTTMAPEPDGMRSVTGSVNVTAPVVNVPLPPMTDGQSFREQFSGQIALALRKFKPEILLISAGFDAHEADPLASLRFREPDYHWVTAELVKAANEHCKGRVVATLEGGYDPTALANSAAAHVRALITT